MALRSLAVMLKGLPRRVPGSGALAPKGNPWSKSSKLTDPTKCGSLEDTDIAKRWPHIAQSIKLRREETRIYNRTTVLITIVGCGYAWRVASHL